jgi:hypothetical protein
MLEKFEKLDDTKKLMLGAVALVFLFLAGYAMFSPSDANRQQAEARQKAKMNKQKGFKNISLDQAKNYMKKRMRRLEKMTDEQYSKTFGKQKRNPATREEMLTKMRGHVNAMEIMTEKEWEVERAKLIQAYGKGKKGKIEDHDDTATDEGSIADEKAEKSDAKEEKSSKEKKEEKPVEEKKP